MPTRLNGFGVDISIGQYRLPANTWIRVSEENAGFSAIGFRAPCSRPACRDVAESPGFSYSPVEGSPPLSIFARLGNRPWQALPNGLIPGAGVGPCQMPTHGVFEALRVLLRRSWKLGTPPPENRGNRILGMRRTPFVKRKLPGLSVLPKSRRALRALRATPDPHVHLPVRMGIVSISFSSIQKHYP